MPKSSAHSPLDGLLELACRDGIDIRPTLLRVLTDLYIQKPFHSSDEEVQYVELALRLIDAVDAATRATVGERLSAYPAAPAAVLDKLAHSSQPTGHRPATHEVDNPASGLERSELFFAASAEERRLILVNLDAVAASTGRKPALASPDLWRRLENAALQHNVGEFSRTLEHGLGIARTLADRITRDPSGEPVVVVAKALGMKVDALQRILLCLNPDIGQSVQRVYELSRLFEEISHGSAGLMLSIWRESVVRPMRHRHAAVLWDDERISARALATPTERRNVRAGVAVSPRIKSNDH
jgi:hypothetical protein